MKYFLILFLFCTTLTIAENNQNKLQEVLDTLCKDPISDFEMRYSKEIHQYKGFIEKAFNELKEKYGKCVNATVIKDNNVQYNYERGIRKGVLYISEDGKITGIKFTSEEMFNDSFEKIKTELATLSGNLSFFVGGETNDNIFAYNESKPLAIGSAFKLYVLRAFRDGINKRRFKCETVLKLKSNHKSLPTGILQNYPDDHAITLDTLTALMISQSDNTATDVMINFLRKDAIEKFYPQNFHPLLTTREMFLLKSKQNEEKIKVYAKGNLKEKLKILKEIETQSVDLAQTSFVDGKPYFIDTVEWFSSTQDLCNLIYTMRDENNLSINPGLFDKTEWNKILFKGGSEPGVINFTHLLQNKKNKWVCISATWNDTEKAVDMEALGSLVKRASGLIKN